MEAIRIEQFVICAPKAHDEFTERPQPLGREYITKGSNVIQRSVNTMHRYAKNYTIGKNTKFCLFVITFSESAKAIEKELDAKAKELSEKEVQQYLASGNIHYLEDQYLGAGK